MTYETTKTLALTTITILIASIASTSVLLMQTADAAQCPTANNGLNRCYATHTFYPSSTKYYLAAKSTHKVFQNVVDNGYVGSPIWGYTTNVPPVLLEVGWRDTPGFSTNAQFYTAKDGGLGNIILWGNPTHNTFYTFLIDDINRDGTWILSAGGTNQTYTVAGSATKLYITKVGYEITYDNNAISTNEFKNLSGYRNGAWFLWNSADGTHPTDYEFPSRPPMFVNHCDGGSWSRVQAGMLSSPPSTCS